MHPHLYELDSVNFSIRQNHRAALQDEYRRILRGERPGRITAIATILRASVAGALIAAGERLRHEPGASPESVVSPALPGEPANTVGVA